MIGAGHALSMPRGNPILRLGDHAIYRPRRPQEVAIETANDPEFTAEQIGWRFALGTLVLVGAYAAWPLIPVVMMTDLDPGVKAALSGLLGATPFMSKFVALAIMGRPAYYFLKRNLFSRIRRRAARPAE